MRPIGFSTGAIAPGNPRLAVEILRSYPTTAVEISALRTNEVKEAISLVQVWNQCSSCQDEPGNTGSFDLLPTDATRLAFQDIQLFQYHSFHAPSKWYGFSELEFLEQIQPLLKEHWPIILHPDAITEWELWQKLGAQIVIENMDGRKPIGRTPEELNPIFARLPQARFCFDIGHAYQIDPTLQLANELLSAYGSRLAEFHVSLVDEQFYHQPLSTKEVEFYTPILREWRSIPIILETPSCSSEIANQLQLMSPLV
ncbi:MAG TPA: hypothetical protein PKA06_14980 [Gemmatales bacterium]|nr:hypothetical protein [Gemmatales bacterium]